MKYTCSFLQKVLRGKRTFGAPFGQSTYKKLCELWGKYKRPVPSIEQIARVLDSIIVVTDEQDNIVGSAIVHKTSIMDDRIKMLRTITVPAGIPGFEILQHIVKLFAQKGRFLRQAFIYDDLGPEGSENRSKIYRDAGFLESRIFVE